MKVEYQKKGTSFADLPEKECFVLPGESVLRMKLTETSYFNFEQGEVYKCENKFKLVNSFNDVKVVDAKVIWSDR
jgi:hypothetical protein